MALDPSFNDETDIVGWVRSRWSNTEAIERIVDMDLLDEFMDSNVKEQTMNVLLVALTCTEKEAHKRPTMRDVVKQLVHVNSPVSSKSGR